MTAVLVLVPGAAQAQPAALTDGAGRQVRVPAKVERVYAAGTADGAHTCLPDYALRH